MERTQDGSAPTLVNKVVSKFFFWSRGGELGVGDKGRGFGALMTIELSPQLYEAL